MVIIAYSQAWQGLFPGPARLAYRLNTWKRSCSIDLEERVCVDVLSCQPGRQFPPSALVLTKQPAKDEPVGESP